MRIVCEVCFVVAWIVEAEGTVGWGFICLFFFLLKWAVLQQAGACYCLPHLLFDNEIFARYTMNEIETDIFFFMDLLRRIF